MQTAQGTALGIANISHAACKAAIAIMQATPY